jgi:hypothetical protein
MASIGARTAAKAAAEAHDWGEREGTGRKQFA